MSHWIFCVCGEDLCWCDNMVLLQDGDPLVERIAAGRMDYVKPCIPCSEGRHRHYPPTATDFIRNVDRLARG